MAADFFTVEVWTKRGLQRIMVLFFIDLATRKVEIAGVASVADGLWMSQIGRNVTDAMGGVLRGKRYLIHDRDPLFTREFIVLLEGIGVTSAPVPPRSPNLKAYASHCTSFEPSATTDTAGQRILSFLPCALRGPSEPEGLYRYSGLSV